MPCDGAVNNLEFYKFSDSLKQMFREQIGFAACDSLEKVPLKEHGKRTWRQLFCGCLT